jgi:hypothetical protein
MNKELFCHLFNRGSLTLGPAAGRVYAALGVALPTATGIRELLTVGGIYDTGTGKWESVLLAIEQ